MKKLSYILLCLIMCLCFNVNALESKTRMLDQSYLVTTGDKAYYTSTTILGTIDTINFYNDGRTFSGVPLDVSMKGDGSVLLYTVGNTYNIVANGDILFPYDSSYLFATLKDTTINFNNSVDTSYVTNMAHMFDSYCYNLTTCNIDISSFDTSKVTTMNDMFLSTGYKSSTLNINVSNIDTSNVTIMTNMFYKTGYNTTGTFTLTGIDNFNTKNVTDMGGMFEYMGMMYTDSFNIDLSNWDTSKVTNMTSMFAYFFRKSEDLSIGNINKWNTSNVTNMNELFRNTGKKLIIDISNWDTSKVTKFDYIFFMSKASEIYLNNITISNTATYTSMFGTNHYLEILGVDSNNLSKVKESLETPDSTYLPGVTGKWYDSNKNGYTVSEMPSNVSYFYAYPPYKVTFMDNTEVIGTIVKPYNKDIKLNLSLDDTTYNVTTKLEGLKDITSLVTVSREIATLDQGYSINDIYNINDDLLLNATINSTVAGELITLDTPVREGYKFKGWSLSKDGLIINEYKPIEDSTLYPIWEENNPNTNDNLITYIVVGGFFLVILVGLIIFVKKNKD